jgi:hypothetical protein
LKTFVGLGAYRINVGRLYVAGQYNLTVLLDGRALGASSLVAVTPASAPSAYYSVCTGTGLGQASSRADGGTSYTLRAGRGYWLRVAAYDEWRNRHVSTRPGFAVNPGEGVFLCWLVGVCVCWRLRGVLCVCCRSPPPPPPIIC